MVSLSDAPVELPAETQERVAALYARLDHVSHYDLLGIHGLSDRKQIKTAYYALAAEFHPDRYFRKNLGPFRHQLEVIFARITLAHDTLSNDQKRADYDDYLDQVYRATGYQPSFETEPEDGLDDASSPTGSELEPTPAAAIATSAAIPEDTRSDEERLQERKRALAWRLRGGRPPPAAAPKQAPAPPADEPPPAPTHAPGEALRAYVEASKEARHRAKVEGLLATARKALAEERWDDAHKAFRQVRGAAAETDAAVLAECSRGELAAASAVADKTQETAEQLFRQGRFAEAAQAWTRVCLGRPGDARAHERAALSLLRAKLDPRRAVALARRAVEIDPQKSAFRFTLARVYAAAGLPTSMESELDRAVVAAGRTADALALASDIRKELKKKPPATP
jgi:curved DNA-binding protein CbpA